MSASRERKKRQEFFAGGGTDPKAVREAERKAKERKSNILYGTIGVVFVLVAAFLVIYNSGILQRSTTAVTIDGVDYSAAEYSYFYHSVYNGYYSQYGDYIDMLVTPTQIHEEALEEMKFVQAALARVEEEGFTLTQEQEEDIQAQLDTFKAEASALGQSYGTHVKQVYGKLTTKSVFEDMFHKAMTASYYALAYQDSLTYSDSDIQAEYDANPNDYDMVDYAYISIDAGPAEETDEDGNTVEPTEEETAAAWEEGQALAEELMTAWENGEDVEALAEEHENATYSSSEGASYSSATYVDWCFEEGREDGEIGLIENEDTSYIYIVQFNGRYRDETPSVNVRHVLINASSLDEGVEATQENLEAKAQEILDTWDGTEEGFAQLANEYSKDAGSNTNGGLYEEVVPGQMVEAFNDWCFDASRKSGDTGIVYNSGTYTGAHIMYYVGQGDLAAWQIDVRSALINRDFSAWREERVGTIESAELKDGASSVV